MQRISRLYVSAALLCLVGLAEGQINPGTPSFSAYDGGQYDTINLQNLNVSLNVPVMSKSGAFPFQFGLSGGDSYVSVNNSAITPGILPTPLADNVNGVLGYYGLQAYATSNSAVTCPPAFGSGSATKYTGWQLGSVDGTVHSLPSTDASYSGATCAGGFTDQVIDGTGYTVVVTSGFTASGVYDRSGGTFNANALSDAQSSPNQITYGYSGGGNYAWKDTLRPSTSTLTRVGGTGLSFNWTDVIGGTQNFSVTQTSYTLRTAYGCTGKTDENLTNQYLDTTLTFPDSTTLGLAWEPTPGFSADRTGRLATLTLRDGSSTVSFNYNPNSAANDGVSCTYLTPAALSRTTSDGTVSYTWAHTTHGNTTTKVDVGGNKTVYTFNSNPVLTEIQAYHNTGTVGSPTYSGTADRTITYCYNGNSASCSTAAVTLPVTEVDSYTDIGVSAGTVRQLTEFDAYGNTLIRSEYDFGASTPTFKTTTVYAVHGSGNCSGIGVHVNNKPCSIVTYDGSLNVISYSKFAYDAYGNVLTSQSSRDGGTTFIGNTTSNVYNTNGTLSKGYDAANNETDYTYDSLSYSDGTCSNPAFPTKIKNATTGLSTQATWDCTGGAKLTSIDASGNVTTNGYKNSSGTADPWWRLSSVKDPLGNVVYRTYTATSLAGSFAFGSSVNNATVTTDGYGRPISGQTEQGPSSTNYDTVSRTFNFGGVSPTVYTSIPCTAASGSSCGSGTGVTNTFDMLGRLTASADGGGGTKAISYPQNDVLSVLGPKPSFDGENTKQTQKQYDGLGRVTSSCRIESSGGVSCGQNTGSSSGVVTTTAYTSATGSQTVTGTRGSQSRSNTVDGLGRVTQTVTPEGGTWNYYYDSVTTPGCPTGYKGVAGQLEAVSDPNGNLQCYAYDSLNRATGVNANGTTCRHFYYDNSTGYSGSIPTGVTAPSIRYGRMVEAATDTCSSGTLVTDEWFSYDKDGHVTDMWESTPHSGTYYHSIATFTGPAITAVQLKSLYTLNYGLDGEGRWNSLALGTTTEVTIPASGSTNGYNAASQPLTIGIGPGSDQDDYTYDSSTGRMTGWTFQVNSVQETAILSWNPIGTLKSLAITDGFNAGGTQTCNFGVSGSQGYDDLNRLLYDSCGSGGSIWNQTYSYDQYDNLTKASTGFVSWNPGYSSTTNHYACTGCTYDSNGNVTNDSTNAYSWNEFSKLKSVNSGATSVYDAFGRTVEIDNGSTHTEIWFTQLGKTAFMNGGSEIYAYWPTPGGGSILYNGNVNFMHKDWLGSARVISLVNSTPSIVTDRAFAPYGEAYDIFGGTTQRQTMFGGDSTQDIVAGMYDTPNRELQGSQQGRWLSPDPAGAEWNLYAYATNPNSFIDPSGLWIKDCTWTGGCGTPCNAWCGGAGGGGAGGGGSINSPSGGIFFTGPLWGIEANLESAWLVSGSMPGYSVQAGELYLKYWFYTPNPNYGPDDLLVGTKTSVLVDLGPVGTDVISATSPTLIISADPSFEGVNNFRNVPPIAGSVWIQLAPAIGITVPFAYIPATDTDCLGVGGGVGGPTSGAVAGPVFGSANPQAVLSGWSVSVSGAYGLGGQTISNSSGTLAGPAYGSKGVTLSVAYSWCWQ